MKTILFAFLLVSALAHASYPKEWWQEVPRATAPTWEILPQDAKDGEVILSKRNELGVFSNFAATPFCLDHKCYASVEGFWQSLKYPDPDFSQEPRHEVTEWSFTRAEVEQMVGFTAKDAGDAANLVYKRYSFEFISYGNNFFNHKDFAEGSNFHYRLIKSAMIAKLKQNPAALKLLMKTKGLILKPDHYVSEKDPAAFKYHKIMMEIRDQENLGP